MAKTLIVVLLLGVALQISSNNALNPIVRNPFEEAIKALAYLNEVIQLNKTEGSAVLQESEKEVYIERNATIESTSEKMSPQIQKLVDEIEVLEDKARLENVDITTCIETKDDLLKITDAILVEITRCTKPIAKYAHDKVAQCITSMYNFDSYLTDLQVQLMMCTSNTCYTEVYEKAEDLIIEIPQTTEKIISDGTNMCYDAISEIKQCAAESMVYGMTKAQNNADFIQNCIEDTLPKPE